MSETKEFKVCDECWRVTDGFVFSGKILGIAKDDGEFIYQLGRSKNWWNLFKDTDLFHTELEAHAENVRRHQQALNQATLAKARAFPDDRERQYFIVFDSTSEPYCRVFWDNSQKWGWSCLYRECHGFDTPAEAIEAVVGGQE